MSVLSAPIKPKLTIKEKEYKRGGIRYLRAANKSIRRRLQSSHREISRIVQAVSAAMTLVKHKQLASKLSSHIKKYAEICDAVYRSEEARKKVAERWHMEIDPEFSTDRVLLLVRRSAVSNKVVETILCFRGTRLVDIEDVKTDMAIIRGKEVDSQLFKAALITCRAAINKYGKRGLMLTGHSLGASLSMYISRELRVPAKVFNPGASGLDLLHKVWQNVKISDRPTESAAVNQRATSDRSLVSVYIVRGDIFSNFLLYNDKINHKVYVLDNVKGTGAHSMDNFIK